MIHARLDSNIFVGVAPANEQDVNSLAEEGVQSVLCLRSTAADDQFSSQDLGVAVSRAGMIYLNFPVASDELNEFHVNSIRTKLKMMPKPVFVHAENWHQAAAVALIDRIAEEDWSSDHAWSYAAEQGIEFDEPHLRAAVERYTEAS